MQIITPIPEALLALRFHLVLLNIALLIRHHYSVYGKRIDSNDISLVAKNWAARKEDLGKVGAAVFVIANGYSKTLLRTLAEKDNNVIDKLAGEADEQLQQFFSGICV
ncbi:hypothetical protein E8E12_008845 [Didymella heteroderae]|uniref:Uncharacterized protein n=1 Tax=Didymella heteroderae TaxID=1769908 RepID=A0A9P4WVH5_9PLEO|nr:hypothetical protein E8E12_008845 [Didymella heteroderae]